MKREWIGPQTIVQKFTANEYVAACGDSGKTYKFTCDAGSWPGGYVYWETNAKDGLQTDDTYLGQYHPCGTTHEASSTDSFLQGYYRPYVGGNAVPVIIWRGSDGKNIHCTTNLDMNSWETAKS